MIDPHEIFGDEGGEPIAEFCNCGFIHIYEKFLNKAEEIKKRINFILEVL